MSGGQHAAGLRRLDTGASWSGTIDLDEFNHGDVALVSTLLGSCLDIPRWVDRVAAGRPFRDVEALRAAGRAAGRLITWEQVAGALDRHPRIGERAAAVAGTGAESVWSSSEQAGVLPDQGAALAAGNLAYEERFGHLYLVCAAGLSGEQILADLRRRLANDPADESPVVMRELVKIADLRLGKAVTA